MPKSIFYPKGLVNCGLIPRGGAGQVAGLTGLPARSLEVTHNDIYTADEFSFEIDGHHFPTDPRTIRALSVEIHMTDVGQAGSALDLKTSNPMLLGHADQVAREYRNREQTFRAKGRDLTGLLLDTQWGDRVVQLGQPLDAIVSKVLADIPSAVGLGVWVDAPLVVPGDPSSKKRNTYRAPQDKSVWEALVGLAVRAGGILYVDNDSVVIAPPRTIDTPDQAPLFVEGRNLTDLTIERELGTSDLPNIRVRAFDPKTGETVIGTHPTTPRARARATKGKKSEEIEWQDHVVKHPAPTPLALAKIAKAMHTYLAFMQLNVKFETKDMTAFTGVTRDLQRFTGTERRRSLTEIRNGSTVRVYIDQQSRKTLERTESVLGVQRALEKQGFAPNVARELAKGWRAIDATLFVDKANHSYTPDDGYTLSVEATSVLDAGS